MIEFSDNNNISSLIFLSSFYLNKDFHSRISFNLNIIIYEFTRERLQAITTSNIITKMKKLLTYETKQLQKNKKIMSY